MSSGSNQRSSRRKAKVEEKSEVEEAESNGVTSAAEPDHVNGSSHADNPILTEDEMRRKGEEAAENYIVNCKKFEITVDPSVVIALKTGWSLLQPSRKFTEGSMLPLMNILDDYPSLTRLNLSNITMQDSRFVFSFTFLNHSDH